jgi:hypothetical protein
MRRAEDINSKREHWEYDIKFVDEKGQVIIKQLEEFARNHPLRRDIRSVPSFLIYSDYFHFDFIQYLDESKNKSTKNYGFLGGFGDRYEENRDRLRIMEIHGNIEDALANSDGKKAIDIMVALRDSRAFPCDWRKEKVDKTYLDSERKKFDKFGINLASIELIADLDYSGPNWESEVNGHVLSGFISGYQAVNYLIRILQ